MPEPLQVVVGALVLDVQVDNHVAVIYERPAGGGVALEAGRNLSLGTYPLIPPSGIPASSSARTRFTPTLGTWTGRCSKPAYLDTVNWTALELPASSRALIVTVRLLPLAVPRISHL